MSKTVLVTGVAGFIASHLTEKLLAQGHTVIGVDNFNDFYDINIKISNLSAYFSAAEITELISTIESPYRHFQNSTNESVYAGFHQQDLRSLTYVRDDSGHCEHSVAIQDKGSASFKLYGLDLCDYKNLRKVFEENKITHIVNIAALAGVRPSTEKPVLYQKNNGESCTNLQALAKEFAIKKFVHASSSSVYGVRPSSETGFKETEDISKPISPYAATKAADEGRLHTMSYLYNIPAVCLRFFTVYGPRQRPDLAITKFTHLIDAGKPIQIYGDGSARRDFTYIEDILDGILKAVDLDCKFEVFNLGESQTTDVNTLVKIIEENLGKKAVVEYTDPVPGDVPLTFADISKSKSVLGYNPQTKIDKGIAKFVEWFKESKLAKL